MNSNQTSKEIFQADSQSFDKDKADFWEKVSNEKFIETVNPDFEQALATQNTQIPINESKQPQERSSITDEESEENMQSPLKFSDFLLKKERNKQVMKIIQEGKEAQNLKKHLTLLNSYLKRTKVDFINKKLSEIALNSQESLLMSEIFETLKSQNIQFEDDQDRFEPLNDGQIVSIQLFHYCVFDLEEQGKAQDSQSLDNPVNIKWKEPMQEVKQENEHFIRLQNLELEEKFKELSGENFEEYSNLKQEIFDQLTIILDCLQQTDQNGPQFEQQVEEAQIFADEIVKLLNSIDKKKQIYHFINEAIYQTVEELKILSLFNGKLEKLIKYEEQNDQILNNLSEYPESISVSNSVAGSLRLKLNEQEQAQVDKDIKDFIQNPDDTEDKFIDYLLETYMKLKDIRPQVISYFQSFKAGQSISQDTVNLKDKLVEIKDFITKQKIIEWLKKNEKQVPSN